MTYEPAILPARYGSSLKYSKLRPQRGLRLIFSPGPNKTFTFWARASFPKQTPISLPSSLSKLEAIVTAVGKQVALSDSFKPKWSAAKACFLIPCGPSAKNIDGIW